MPANKYALLRYRIIDKSIRNKFKPYPSKEALRLACEEALYNSSFERISDSTIEKDLFAMRNEEGLGYFAPIKFSREYNGYYYDDPNYSIDDLPLSDEDIESIKLAAATLGQFRHLQVFEQFGAAIDKILGRVSLSADLNKDSLSKFIEFEDSPPAKGTEHIQTLLTSIQEKNQTLLTYKSFLVGIESVRTIEPYLLKEFRNRWYVIALDSSKNTIKTFALDRISEVKLKDEPFKSPIAFDTENFFKHTYGITTSNTPPNTIRLKFDEKQSHYIRTQPLHHTQKIVEDDLKSIVVEYELHITPEWVMLLLSFGSHVEVLEPSSLKERLQEEMGMALKNYLKL
jgi:predicted DNA-binding transcriptional regulator YafY